MDCYHQLPAATSSQEGLTVFTSGENCSADAKKRQPAALCCCHDEKLCKGCLHSISGFHRGSCQPNMVVSARKHNRCFMTHPHLGISRCDSCVTRVRWQECGVDFFEVPIVQSSSTTVHPIGSTNSTFETYEKTYEKDEIFDSLTILTNINSSII